MKSAIEYLMLLIIVGGVGLACVKEGKGIDINYFAFGDPRPALGYVRYWRTHLLRRWY